MTAASGSRPSAGVRRSGSSGCAHDHAGFVDASLDSNADDEHDPEGATIAFERSQVATLARQATSSTWPSVDAALARLDAGTYGDLRAAAGAPIPEARLEARPAARTSVGCAP